MRNEAIRVSSERRVVLMDTISAISAVDEGSVIVCGSHGGAISGAFALLHPPAFVIFNDAGIGKNRAGLASLEQLARHAVPAACLSHESARIGDSKDAWDDGRVSSVNELAKLAGVAAGMTVPEAVACFAPSGAKEVLRR